MTGINSGKTVLITGASGGIGLELARLFARDGYTLILIARSRNKLEDLAEQFQSEYNIKVFIVVKDLARLDSAQELFNEIQKQDIVVDILINNAGFGALTSF